MLDNIIINEAYLFKDDFQQHKQLFAGNSVCLITNIYKVQLRNK